MHLCREPIKNCELCVERGQIKLQPCFGIISVTKLFLQSKSQITKWKNYLIGKTILTFSFDLCQASVIDFEMSESVQQKFCLFRNLDL